jgi:hypothetical protein
MKIVRCNGIRKKPDLAYQRRFYSINRNQDKITATIDTEGENAGRNRECGASVSWIHSRVEYLLAGTCSLLNLSIAKLGSLRFPDLAMPAAALHEN